MRMRRGAALVGALALLLLLRGPALLSCVWGNVGQVILARVVTAAPGEPSLQTVARAERLLHQAVAWDGENRGAHRGLGWALAAQGRNEDAGAEWQVGGFTVHDFIARGEQARRAKQYDEAMIWYRRATWLEPDLGDPYYYIGLAYEGMEKWNRALRAYAQALELNFFLGGEASLSSAYYHIGIIYQQEEGPRDLEKALVAYQEAIRIDSFGSNYAQEAKCHYRLGMVLKQSGRDPDEYIVEFERAVQLHPRHGWAHHRLGVAYYEKYEDVRMAERELQLAIEISPTSKWAYWSLGNIYRKAQEYEKATGMYEKMLELDPEYSPARRRLEEIRERFGE
jgi:tetratricopeptide (TPR) repeat protein